MERLSGEGVGSESLSEDDPSVANDIPFLSPLLNDPDQEALLNLDVKDSFLSSSASAKWGSGPLLSILSLLVLVSASTFDAFSSGSVDC